MLNLESKSSLEGKKFLECKEYREKGRYKEIERDNYIILSSKLVADELLKARIEYHIIAEIPNYASAYTLYHTSNPTKAKMFFDYFAPILNPILRCKFSVPTQIEILKKATKYPRFIMRNQWTLCHVFAKFNIFEVFDLIRQNPKSNNEIITRLNQHVLANVNRQTLSKRFTALHMAIRKKCYKFAEKLVQLTAQTIDFRLADWKGNNVFHYAVLIENKNKEFLKLLLTYCPREQLIDALRAKNCRQCTALHLACYSHKLECIKLILKIPLPIECFVITNDCVRPELGTSDDPPASAAKSGLIRHDLGFASSITSPVGSGSGQPSDSGGLPKRVDNADLARNSLDKLGLSAAAKGLVTGQQAGGQQAGGQQETTQQATNQQATTQQAATQQMTDSQSASSQPAAVQPKPIPPKDPDQPPSNSPKSSPTLIQFSKHHINSFVEEEEEIFKGGTPLHWCSDKRYIGELLQMGFIAYLNVRNINQETALHVAVKRNSYRFMVILFCTGETIDQSADCTGNTPLHSAVTAGNLSLVKLLTVFGDESTLNSKNNLGLTPRHLAAQNPSKAHAEILNALHLLGAKRCDEEQPNDAHLRNARATGKPPEGDAGKLIRCNAGCSKYGDYNGISIYECEEHEEECWYTNFVLKRIAKNIQAKRGKKETPETVDRPFEATTKSSKTLVNAVLKNCLSLMKLAGSKEKLPKKSKPVQPVSSLDLVGPRDLKESKEIKDDTARHPKESKDSGKELPKKGRGKSNRVLCIDGGGIKGIFAVQMLIELEKRLKRPLSSYFNWFAGTSTGSFIATLISLNYNLTHIRTLYFLIKNKVFQNNLPYDDEILEGYLRKYLGERTMASVPNCKLTIASTLYDRLPIQLHLFRNYPSPHELMNKPPTKARLDNKDRVYRPVPGYREQVLWKACRASSAAPIYFNSFGSFCDGGLISNSPVIDVITEHFVYNELYEELGEPADRDQELEFILSLGCGQTNIRLNDYEYDFSSFSRVDRLLKFAINAKPFSMILISELNNTEHHKQLRTMAWCKAMDIPYVRLSPYLGEKISLDERNDEVIVNGLWKCKAYFRLKKEIIDELVHLLESSCPEADERQRPAPKFDLNYTTDFDETKVTTKELRKQMETVDELPDEDKKPGPMPYDP